MGYTIGNGRAEGAAAREIAAPREWLQESPLLYVEQLQAEPIELFSAYPLSMGALPDPIVLHRGPGLLRRE